MNKNLIPPGFRDDLSPVVEKEHAYTNKIISIFNSNGYLMVKPPLIEFYKKLDREKNVFLISDENELSNLKIREDITMQVARIASTRLKKIERPLRLCYYGEVVRSKGSMLRPERQFLQVGAECIGEKSILADCEILLLAVRSLQSVGIKNISIDLSTPIFLDNIINNELVDKNKKNTFLKYIKRKDVVKTLSYLKNNSKKRLIENLFNSSGKLESKIKFLDQMMIGKQATTEINNIKKIFNLIKRKIGDTKVNIDFTEVKTNSYYSGINYTIFAKNIRGEIARGGRYLTNNEEGEYSVGFTCYMDTVLRASSAKNSNKRIIVPFNISDQMLKNLIKRNFIIEKSLNIKSLTKTTKSDFKKNCNYALINNKIVKI